LHEKSGTENPKKRKRKSEKRPENLQKKKAKSKSLLPGFETTILIAKIKSK
jgi:hypothetical protein